ncbi:MAG: hypothetical protein AAF299_01785 [Pseudomonadota bacterium]
MISLKPAGLLFTLALVTQTGIALSAEPRIKIHDHQWGGSCSNQKSFAVRMKSWEFSKKIDAKVCLERLNGSWSCYVATRIDPSEIFPSTFGWQVCEGTGNIKWWARYTGSGDKFGKP